MLKVYGKHGFTATKKSKGLWELHFSNGVHVGDLVCGDDGYFAYWPDKEKYGCYSGWSLIAIGELLDSLNSQWHEQLMKDMEKVNAKESEDTSTLQE
jgi:hypothetical protein